MKSSDVSFFVRSRLVEITLGVIIIVFLLNRFGFFGWGKIPQGPLLAASVEQSDPCIKTERCMIAYVAPWCPSCRESVGFLNGLYKELSNRDKLGMKIIIGMAEKGELERMAKNFLAPVYYDDQGTFAAKVGIRSVPNVLLVKSDGEISEKGLPGAISGLATEKENIDYYLRYVLKVDF